MKKKEIILKNLLSLKQAFKICTTLNTNVVGCSDCYFDYRFLQWCTTAENTQRYFDSIRIEKPIIKKKIKLIGKVGINTNEIIKKYNTFLDDINDINALKKYTGTISCYCKGYRKTALGYKCIFLNE